MFSDILILLLFRLPLVFWTRGLYNRMYTEAQMSNQTQCTLSLLLCNL
jgi:hypothetical protein